MLHFGLYENKKKHVSNWSLLRMKTMTRRVFGARCCT